MSNARIDSSVELELGDCVTLGDDVNVVGQGKLKIGDYTKVHRGTFIICLSDITIGHNCWIGERCVIDGTAELKIGDSVGIGMGTSVFTHASFGDTFSGCTIRSSKKVTVGDEAWLVGQSVVQACSVARRAVVMPMSNVTSDITAPNTVWSGNPATDCTAQHGVPWIETSVEFRERRFNTLLRAYERETGADTSWIKSVTSLPAAGSAGTTYFSMSDRKYTKRGTVEERSFMRWLLAHNKAKFTPEE